MLGSNNAVGGAVEWLIRLLWGDGGLDIAFVTLPSLKKQAITLASTEVRKDEFPYIYALAGPDEEGRIAYIEDYFFVPRDSDRRHLLKTVKLDGTGVQTLLAPSSRSLSSVARGPLPYRWTR